MPNTMLNRFLSIQESIRGNGLYVQNVTQLFQTMHFITVSFVMNIIKLIWIVNIGGEVDILMTVRHVSVAIQGEPADQE